MSYAVKEIFYTLQGEGFHAGRPAVFCRFSGCNLWSGREEQAYLDDDIQDKVPQASVSSPSRNHEQTCALSRALDKGHAR